MPLELTPTNVVESDYGAQAIHAKQNSFTKINSIHSDTQQTYYDYNNKLQINESNSGNILKG